MLAPILELIGYGGAIAEAVHAIYDFADFFNRVKNAQSEKALQEAGDIFAHVVVTLGIEAIFALLGKLAHKSRSDLQNRKAGNSSRKKIKTEDIVGKKANDLVDVPDEYVLQHYVDSNGVTKTSIRRKSSEVGDYLFVDENGIIQKGLKKQKYNRNFNERKKFLLEIANDENSNISSEIKTYILETGGKKVPEGFEVSHKVPLYTKNIKDRKLLDISDNMELIPKELHRQMHMFCGNTYHLYNPSLFKY